MDLLHKKPMAEWDRQMEEDLNSHEGPDIHQRILSCDLPYPSLIPWTGWRRSEEEKQAVYRNPDAP